MDGFVSWLRQLQFDGVWQTALLVAASLLCITFHETCHGLAAYRLGDPTAKRAGRLTLNPLKHLDPIGTICMIFFHFGWAKPVPINSRYFKKPRRDMALTAAAGPIMNFILALFGMLVCRILTKIFVAFPAQSDFVYYIQYAALTLFSYFHMLNLSLGVFHLIPIPPLDGSRIFYIFLPPKWYFGVMKYEKYIQLALLVLLWTGLLSRPLSAAVSWISGGMQWLVSWI